MYLTETIKVSEPSTKACHSSFCRKNDLLAALALVLLCIGTFFSRLGVVGMIDVSESFYPAAVREMIEAHSYIVPQINYQMYFSKPILTFWLLAAGYHLFGLNEFAGRFFPAVFAIALVMACFWVIRVLSGTRAGFLAGTLLAGSPYFLLFTRASSIDAFFSVFLGLAMCSLLLVVSAGRTKWWPLVYVFLALAVLTKGPAALILFGGGCLVPLIWLRPSRSATRATLASLHILPGLCLFLAITLPWYVAVQIATKGLFLKVFFLYENLGRMLGHTNLRRAFWWRYVLVLLGGLLPWSVYLPAVFYDGWRQAKTSPQLEATGHASLEILVNPRLLCLGWAAVVIVFFSLSKTQMETYVLPACAPLAMATALTLNDWWRQRSKFGLRWLKAVSAIVAGLGCVAAIAGLMIPPQIKGMQPYMVQTLAAAGLLLLLGWTAQYLVFKRGRVSDSLIAMSVTTCLASALALPIGIEYWYTSSSQSDLHDLCRLIKGTNAQIGLFMTYRPSVMYYTQDPVDCFFMPEKLRPYDQPDKSDQPVQLDQGAKANQPDQRDKTDGHNQRGLYVLSQRYLAPRLAWDPRIVVVPVKEQGIWGLYQIKGARLQKYPTLEQSFKWMTTYEMISSNKRLYGLLTDCWSGGTMNLPERLRF